MKIAVDIRSLGSKRLTGVGYYLYNSLVNLSEIDKSIDWQFINSGIHDKNSHPVFNFKFDYRHLKLPNKLINLASIIGFGPSISDVVRGEVDFVWLPNINFYISKKNTPYILTVHDLSFLHSHSFYSNKRKIWHKLVAVKKLVNNAKAIIAVSENTKRDIVRFFSIDEDKIFVVYPGIDYKKISTDDARAITRHLNLPEKYFLFVGTLEPRKNVSGLIKAFDRLHQDYPDFQLVLVGKRGWMYSRLMQEINKRSYIRYLGYQAGLRKDAIYKLSYAFIWPSFYEGFGFPPLEAMAHKKPVISSYKTSLPETQGNQAIYVDPYNSTDMYTAMKMLIEDQHLYLSLITSNAEIPHWNQQGQEILDIFKKIIQKK